MRRQRNCVIALRYPKTILPNYSKTNPEQWKRSSTDTREEYKLLTEAEEHRSSAGPYDLSIQSIPKPETEGTKSQGPEELETTR
jgi:hypothetical protein